MYSRFPWLMPASERSLREELPRGSSCLEDVTEAYSMPCQVCDKWQPDSGRTDVGSQSSLSTLLSKAGISATRAWAPGSIQSGEPREGLAWEAL